MKSVTMKQLTILYSLVILFILSACSSKDEPDYPVYMQPSSIQSADIDANNQSFEYDDYGRIVSWSCTSDSHSDAASYSALYSYPDANTIEVTAQEFISLQQHSFENTIQLKETIHLKNGRASNSEGTYNAVISNDAGTTQMQKTYRLVFDYLPTNHLNTVEHLEVFGIGDDVKDNDWDNAWRWMNYLIWENGNLKEFQDYQGNTTPYQSIKFEYTEDKVTYPVIIPTVIKFHHHLPLIMKGVFGSNSVNLVKSALSFDHNDNLNLSRQYSYEFEDDRISKYTETFFINSIISNPITYNVSWTEK
ncbi:MAG: hypothetical protein K2M93_08320 [Muribaculaceae bacterium]|nr:hypothetical protein [Muribaculaceae bacterium]